MRRTAPEYGIALRVPLAELTYGRKAVEHSKRPKIRNLFGYLSSIYIVYFFF